MDRLRAVSLFSWSVEQNARDTQMTTRVTEGARRRPCFSQRSRACTPLTKSEEKERLLAVYSVDRQSRLGSYTLYFRGLVACQLGLESK